MLHHFSLTAEEPLHVAEVLAELMGGRVSPFGPWPGGYIALSPDGAGTAVEVYPKGTELQPDPENQAAFRHNHFAQRHTGTHAALSVDRTEEEVFAVAQRCGWQLQRCDRGGFEVLEMWLENRVMLEVMTPAMLRQYLAVVGAPRISTGGDEVRQLEFAARVRAPIAQVWRAWTDAEALQEWWGLAQARVDLRIGGSYELLFPAEDADGAPVRQASRILSYVPERMLSFTWAAPAHLDMGREHTWVVLSMVRRGRSTDLTLSHCGFGQDEQWETCREYFRRAWRRSLHRFESQYRTYPQVIPTQPDTIDLRDGSRAPADDPAPFWNPSRQ